MNLKKSPFSILDKDKREMDYIKGVYKRKIQFPSLSDNLDIYHIKYVDKFSNTLYIYMHSSCCDDMNPKMGGKIQFV